MANSALVVVDVQVGQLEGSNSVYQANLVLHNIQHLLNQARANQTPVLFVQHDEEPGETFAVGSAYWSIHPSITPLPTELVIHKRSADAFHHTELHEELTTRKITHLIIVGCKTQYCIDTTCRRAVSLGYHVTLISDAHTTWDTDVLPAMQIVAHHNNTLDDFGNDKAWVTLRATNEIDFRT